MRARLRARRRRAGGDRRAHGRDPRERAKRSQPVRARTGGSTFRNPPDMKAWELIDAAGCRGLTRGGAQVSEKHCNFLINTGNATAADIEGLGEEVRRRVLAATGVHAAMGNPSHRRAGGSRSASGMTRVCRRCTAAFPPNARSACPPACR